MDATLGRLVATAAARFGGKPVVIAVDRTLTFIELDRLSTQFARALRTLDVGPGDRVTLWVENGWRWMVAYYAVLKLGAVVNPCNILLTADEVAFIVGDCGAKVLIASRDKAPTLPATLAAQIITDKQTSGSDLDIDSMLERSAQDEALEIWSDA